MVRVRQSEGGTGAGLEGGAGGGRRAGAHVGVHPVEGGLGRDQGLPEPVDHVLEHLCHTTQTPIPPTHTHTHMRTVRNVERTKKNEEATMREQSGRKMGEDTTGTPLCPAAGDERGGRCQHQEEGRYPMELGLVFLLCHCCLVHGTVHMLCPLLLSCCLMIKNVVLVVFSYAI